MLTNYIFNIPQRSLNFTYLFKVHTCIACRKIHILVQTSRKGQELYITFQRFSSPNSSTLYTVLKKKMLRIQFLPTMHEECESIHYKASSVTCALVSWAARNAWTSWLISSTANCISSQPLWKQSNTLNSKTHLINNGEKHIVCAQRS